MRLRKVINRVYQGTTYYRWIVSVPPKDVRQLGWVEGMELEALARGSTLTLAPSSRPRMRRKLRQSEEFEESIRRRSISRS